MAAFVPGSKPSKRWLGLALWLLLVFAVAMIGSLATSPKIPAWYASLNKPAFTPPSWLFAPVWTILYALMGVAAWRVARGGGPSHLHGSAAWLFFGQLALNGLWSPAFFALENPALGLAVILLLITVLVPTLVVFLRHDRPAGLMLLPYLAWVGFAAILNGAIVMLN